LRSKTLAVAFTIIFLTLFNVSSVGIMLVGYSTYTNYSNPYSYVPTRPASSIPAWGRYVNHTVIFLLDGVRPDVFNRIDRPYIQSQTWTNFTDVQCSTLLSVSEPGASVISSGVNSTESEVTSNDYDTAFKGDSLWNETLRHGGTTAVCGSDEFQTMFGPWINYSITFNSTMPGERSFASNITNGGTPVVTPVSDYRDSIVAVYATQVVQKYKPTFMVVHFSLTDEAAHANGTINPDGSISTTYATAIQNDDTYIRWVLGNYTAAGIFSSTLVVIASDHGHINKGGHGGIEPEVLHIVLLMMGNGTKTGTYDTPVLQNSIAPTVAALMGWEVPSDASGTVLFEGLNLTPLQEAVYRINLAQIRLAQANTTRQKTGLGEPYQTLLEGATQSLAWATDNFTAANYTGAINNAVSSESASRNVLGSVLNAKMLEEITGRVILATSLIAIVVALLALLLYRARTKVKDAIIGGRRLLPGLIVSTILYFVLLVVNTFAFGWVFSASSFPDSVTAVLGGVLAPTLLALIPSSIIFISVLLFLNRNEPRSNGRIVTWIAIFILTTTVLYAAAMIWYIAPNGPGLPWYAHDVNGAIGYFYIVISGIEFSLSALIGFLVGLGVSKLLPSGKQVSGKVSREAR
jgi:hypothetical protein